MNNEKQEVVHELPESRLLLKSPGLLPGEFSGLAVQNFATAHPKARVAVVTAQPAQGPVRQFVLRGSIEGGIEDNTPPPRYQPDGNSQPPSPFGLYFSAARSIPLRNAQISDAGWKELLDPPPFLMRERGTYRWGAPWPATHYIVPTHNGKPMRQIGYPLGAACFLQVPVPFWIAGFFAYSGGAMPTPEQLASRRILVCVFEQLPGRYLVAVLPGSGRSRKRRLTTWEPGSQPIHRDVWRHVVQALVAADVGVKEVGEPIVIQRETPATAVSG